ncbi:hypothetical protein BYT27DRAFT_7200956, partial [Phlegmacium glaucopus]
MERKIYLAKYEAAFRQSYVYVFETKYIIQSVLQPFDFEVGIGKLNKNLFVRFSTVATSFFAFRIPVYDTISTLPQPPVPSSPATSLSNTAISSCCYASTRAGFGEFELVLEFSEFGLKLGKERLQFSATF